jgi:hypothetical protein
MKLPAMALLLLSLGGVALSQEQATTTSGRIVILNPDGTWKDQQPASAPARPTGGHLRPAAATEKLELSRNKCTIYFNPKLWKVGKTSAGKTTFEHTDGDGYAMVIAERIEMTPEAFRSIALENAMQAAPDAKITFEEKRSVNGRDVICRQIKGTIQSIPFVYYGYYYTGKEGSIQVLTYTAQNLFSEYEKDFVDFLDGFSIDR